MVKRPNIPDEGGANVRVKPERTIKSPKKTLLILDTFNLIDSLVVNALIESLDIVSDIS